METLLGNIELTELCAKKLFSKLSDTNADIFICSNINVLPLTHLIASQIVNEYVFIPYFKEIDEPIRKKIENKTAVFIEENVHAYNEIIELEKNLNIFNCKIDKILAVNSSIQHNKVISINRA